MQKSLKNDAHIICSTDTDYINKHFWYFIYVLQAKLCNVTFTLTPIFFIRQQSQNNGRQSCSTSTFWRVAGWGGTCFSLNLTKHKHLNSDSSSLAHTLFYTSFTAVDECSSHCMISRLVHWFCYAISRHWHKLHVNRMQFGRVSSDSGSIPGTISIDRWGSVCMPSSNICFANR